MNIKPLNNHLIIEFNENDITNSGILVSRHDDLSDHGKVLAVSKDIDDVSVGDVVFFPKYAGENIEFFAGDGKREKYVSIKYSSLLAVQSDS